MPCLSYLYSMQRIPEIMGIGSPPVSAHDKHRGRVYTLRFGIKDTQSRVWRVGQASSRLAVVSRAGAWSCCSLFTQASYCSASMVHLSLSIAASTPQQWRRRGCLHEEKSIWHVSYEVKRIYLMGIMHNRHTHGSQSEDAEQSWVPPVYETRRAPPRSCPT